MCVFPEPLGRKISEEIHGCTLSRQPDPQNLAETTDQPEAMEGEVPCVVLQKADSEKELMLSLVKYGNKFTLSSILGRRLSLPGDELANQKRLSSAAKRHRILSVSPWRTHKEDKGPPITKEPTKAKSMVQLCYLNVLQVSLLLHNESESGRMY